MHRVAFTIVAALLVVVPATVLTGCGGNTATPAAEESSPAAITSSEKAYMRQVKQDGPKLLALERQFKQLTGSWFSGVDTRKLNRDLKSLWNKMVKVSDRWEGKPSPSARFDRVHKAWVQVLNDNGMFLSDYSFGLDTAETHPAGMVGGMALMRSQLGGDITKMKKDYKRVLRLMRQVEQESMQ